MDKSLSTVDGTTYDVLVAELDKGCKQIIAEKRKVYTQGSHNVLRNFQEVARLTGQTAGQVLAVYWAKHLISCMNALCKPHITDSEIATRFQDARNYLDLGYVLYTSGLAHE